MSHYHHVAWIEHHASFLLSMTRECESSRNPYHNFALDQTPCIVLVVDDKTVVSVVLCEEVDPDCYRHMMTLARPLGQTLH